MRPDLVVGMRDRLAPGPESVAQARQFVAATLIAWDAELGTQLSRGWSRCDPDLLERLMASALETRGVFVSSEWWSRLAGSRWVRQVGTRYWLVVGPLRLVGLLPRWEMRMEPSWHGADRRWPIVLTARAVMDQGEVRRLRIEVWDTRMPEEVAAPEDLQRWMAALEPGCRDCGRFSPPGGGVTTWAEVDLSSVG